ncbi:MAG: helix-turn-helix domain-containing protein [Defluviitaleaceae bacterium]|nr:helix-turn-helix domain-containing protein [Defluviitaleaceae bacterium]
MDWITPKEVGDKWGIKERRVQIMCSRGQIPGVVRKGRMWLIPKDTPKPIDGRTKAGRELKRNQNAE